MSAYRWISPSLSPSLSLEQEEGVKPIKRLVRSHVKEATLLSNVGAEVSFQLPNDSSSSFQGMLTEIDDRKAELGIDRCVCEDACMCSCRCTHTRGWSIS